MALQQFIMLEVHQQQVYNHHAVLLRLVLEELVLQEMVQLDLVVVVEVQEEMVELEQLLFMNQVYQLVHQVDGQ